MKDFTDSAVNAVITDGFKGAVDMTEEVQGTVLPAGVFNSWMLEIGRVIKIEGGVINPPADDGLSLHTAITTLATRVARLNAGFIGEVKAYAGTTAPTGWMICNGGHIAFPQSYTEYLAWVDSQAPWLRDGMIYRVPDLRNRTIVGAGGDYVLGTPGGSATHTLTASEIPPHTHGLWGADAGGTSHASAPVQNGIAADTTASAGGGLPHNNMPPYMPLNYIIRVKMV